MFSFSSGGARITLVLADSYLITKSLQSCEPDLEDWTHSSEKKSSQGTLEFNYIWKIAAITQQQISRSECLISATDLHLGFSYKPLFLQLGGDSFIYLSILIPAECAQQQV